MSPAELLPGSAARRISTLDGWRAIAISLVILDHAFTFTRFHEAFWARLGSCGVDIFFVVSGYIITSRMLQELEETSTISRASFYRRRAFRILPIVVVYLSVLFLLSLRVDLVDFHRSELLGSLFFFRNYQLAPATRESSRTISARSRSKSTSTCSGPACYCFQADAAPSPSRC